MDLRGRHKLSIRVTGAVLLASLFIALLGNFVFQAFGITLDSFRVGTGFLLFYNSFTLVHGGTKGGRQGRMSSDTLVDPNHHEDDIAVVPLAIPVTIGPATTGALLVLGTELNTPETLFPGLGGIIAAILTVGFLLYSSTFIEKLIRKRGLIILSKLTGLILSALAAQMVMTGIRNSFS